MKPQFKREEIYLDLSKLSGEERLLTPKIIDSQDIFLKDFINDGNFTDYYDLHFGKYGWTISKNLEDSEKQELTYSQFLDMMGESEEVLQVENKISIKEITELCNEYNRSDLKISNLKRDLEYKKSWNEESFAIQEIKQQISILQKIKETAQSKLQEIGIVF